MIKNYFKIAWRNLMKNKTFSFINIFGLSIGLTCCLLIALYLDYELSYDTQHTNGKQVYQVGTIFVKQNEDHPAATTPAAMGQVMKQEFPEVEESVKLLGLFGEGKTLLRYSPNNGDAVSFYEEKGYLTDPTFFRFFNYQFIEGNPASALINPNTVVINEEIAHKLFGNQSALNKIIHISSGTNGEGELTVTGVIRNNNGASHIDGRFFLSFKGGEMEKYVNRNGNNLAYNNMFYTYVKLKPGSDPKKLEAKFPAFIEKYAGNDLRKAGFYKKQYLTPLKDIHLYSKAPENVTPTGSAKYLYILGSIAIFTLIIACINFMNLSTARSSKRSAEVGIRKVLGANRNGLVTQFLGESLLMSIIAFVFAIGLTELCLPAFAAVSGKGLTLTFSSQGWIIAAFFVLAVITGLLAGLYPAFYLSSFKPVSILKGKFTNSLAAVSLRKGLVVFQFFISAVLIISSVVISKQMQYMRSQDLGFTKDQELIIPFRTKTARQLYTSLKSELAKLGDVKSVGASLYYPGIFNPSDASFARKGQSAENTIVTKMNFVDENYIQTIGIKLVAGRLFSKDFPNDTARGIILNEETVRKLGFASPQQALGRTIFSSFSNDQNNPLDVVGVVKDFNFQDLHLAITPYGFGLNNDNMSYNYMLVHLGAGDMSKVITQINAVWHRLNPGEPMEYNFLDREFEKNYSAQDKLASMVKYFTIIAILISCLGLFGLATFSVEQRTKEIGIRKVLGATVSNLVVLVAKDFIRLVFIAIVIASPVAWWIMHTWLQDFAYRTNIGWTVFVVSGTIACMIAFITVSTQAIRAAVGNPVKSLRTE